MDLKTNYLGLDLKNPIVPSASPFSKDISNIKKFLWSINKIDIYTQNLTNEKILNFEKVIPL